MFKLRITGDLGFEVWQYIPGFEDYFMSSTYGRLESVARYRVSRGGCICPVKDRILCLSIDKYGYQTVTLNKDGVKKTYKVHKLIALTFLPNFFNNSQINHKDENKQNNCVWNLEWCNGRYNINYGTGRSRSAEKSKKKVLQYDTDGNFIKEWNSVKEAAESLNKSHTGISQNLNGKTNSAYGYVWKFKS
ncbi:NUMOD4 domain-containing protein [Fibrobacter sp.]|uniref:NUMOD4 domain-containing protein n=1 Tax=Fibrobacter sp. TaxID=35828 RepID=UPI00386C4586